MAVAEEAAPGRTTPRRADGSGYSPWRRTSPTSMSTPPTSSRGSGSPSSPSAARSLRRPPRTPTCMFRSPPSYLSDSIVWLHIVSLQITLRFGNKLVGLVACFAGSDSVYIVLGRGMWVCLVWPVCFDCLFSPVLEYIVYSSHCCIAKTYSIKH